MSEEQAQMLLERRAVVALSIPLFTRNIWKNNFLQAALGAELRLQGCTSSAIDALNTMGLCQNKDTVRLLLLRLQNGKAPVSIRIAGAELTCSTKYNQVVDKATANTDRTNLQSKGSIQVVLNEEVDNAHLFHVYP